MSPSIKNSLERALLAADVELQHWAAAYPALELVQAALDSDMYAPGWTDTALQALAAAHSVMSVPGFGDVASDMALVMIETAMRRPQAICAA